MAKYLASWDGKYYNNGKGKAENHTLAWFNEDRGYENEDIRKIKKLKVGESVGLDKGHIVVRVA